MKLKRRWKKKRKPVRNKKLQARIQNWRRQNTVIERTDPKTNYEKFLDSEAWMKFRKKVLADKCTNCPRRRCLQVHHLTYENGIFHEESVITLCKDCHALVHRRHQENPTLTLREVTELILKGEMF